MTAQSVMSESRGIESEVCITSWGMWLVVADASSPLSDPTFWSVSMPPADRMATVRSAVSRGEAIDWTLILDGTFLVRVIVDESAVLDTPSKDSWMEVRRLELPTGQLVIRSGDPKKSAVSICTLSPGIYQARVEWFVEQESKHYDIESPDAYPAGEGPDGIITLRRARS